MYNEVIDSIARNEMSNNPAPGKEYIGEEGFLHCGICGEPVQQYVEEMRNFLNGGIVPTQCRCMRVRSARFHEARKRSRALEKITELQREGFSDPAYLKLTFDMDNGSSQNARTISEWYIENFSELKAQGKGLMFMGNPGTGKTFYACCIANALIERGIAVWVTTMQPLLRKAGDFNRADEIFRKIQTVDLLILDDFGAMQHSSRNLDLLFEVIDTRARSGLPLIITTNLSPAEFSSDSLELQRIFSRVKGMCCSVHGSPVVMIGEDQRIKQVRLANDT